MFPRMCPELKTSDISFMEPPFINRLPVFSHIHKADLRIDNPPYWG